MPSDAAEDARRMGVDLDEARWRTLDRYVELLCRWNAHFNLISRRDVDRIRSRHVLDSLSIQPILAALPFRGARRRALDVGTGAGFPGLPLAVADPSTDWLLVDRNARKVRFLELVVSELDLDNVTVRCLDLDGTPPGDLVAWADVIVSRAVEAPAALIERARAMLAEGGTFVLMTGAAGSAGARADDALAGAMPEGFRIVEVKGVRIPGLDRLHEVTIIRRDADGRAERGH
ncbi:MAG: 16S rRNA (guanine(527)-N(7))-methyltransferase RsmG [Pseudomonadales bacterium]